MDQTRYTTTRFCGSHIRVTRISLNSQLAEAPNTTSLAGNRSGTVMAPVARQAMLNRLGSVARPTVPLIPPVSARDT